MGTRDLNRRSVALVLIGGLVTQGLYGALRGASLIQTVDWIRAAYDTDPVPDIVLNIALGVLSLLAAAWLLTTRRAAWWAGMAIVVAGTVDSIRLSVSPWAGTGYWALFVLRVVVIYLFWTPLARATFSVRIPSR